MIDPAALINLARESNPEDPELWLAVALAELFDMWRQEVAGGYHHTGPVRG